MPSSTADWTPTLDAYEDTLKTAVAAARDMARMFLVQAKAVAEIRERNQPCGPEYGVSAYWLILSGTQGCGKTMLATQLVQRAFKIDPFAPGAWVAGTEEYRESSRRPGIVWMHEKDFASRLKGGEHDLPERFAREWVVAIDDVGHAHDPSRYVADALARLAEVRMGRWTIFTTNLALQDIAGKVEPRLASRMVRDGNKFIAIKAGDYALRRTT